ncbi:hypothetical protein H0H81_003325 [Sphagnurus paluster]|uniref:Uncharacterized protein n=1 Tax=Sphagnurus paluster TaxID=117069 RepID=A0A9P7FWT5_9AGAR|nr:hypothetical protein H0H81_003325 [Sphagnurus paluster]
MSRTVFFNRDDAHRVISVIGRLRLLQPTSEEPLPIAPITYPNPHSPTRSTSHRSPQVPTIQALAGTTHNTSAIGGFHCEPCGRSYSKTSWSLHLTTLKHRRNTIRNEMQAQSSGAPQPQPLIQRSLVTQEKPIMPKTPPPTEVYHFGRYQQGPVPSFFATPSSNCSGSSTSTKAPDESRPAKRRAVEKISGATGVSYGSIWILAPNNDILDGSTVVHLPEVPCTGKGKRKALEPSYHDTQWASAVANTMQAQPRQNSYTSTGNVANIAPQPSLYIQSGHAAFTTPVPIPTTVGKSESAMPLFQPIIAGPLTLSHSSAFLQEYDSLAWGTIAKSLVAPQEQEVTLNHPVQSTNRFPSTISVGTTTQKPYAIVSKKWDEEKPDDRLQGTSATATIAQTNRTPVTGPSVIIAAEDFIIPGFAGESSVPHNPVDTEPEDASEDLSLWGSPIVSLGTVATN